MKKIDLNLVPEIVKDIANRANPENVHVGDNERMMATVRLETINAYVSKVLEVISTPKKGK